MAGVFLIGDRDFKVGYTVRTGSIEGVVESVDPQNLESGMGTARSILFPIA